jgi:hypothetical protein
VAVHIYRDMIPVLDSPAEKVLYVPLDSSLAETIGSVRLEAGGVLLPAECTAGWNFRYSQSKGVAAINGWSNSFPCLRDAQLLPCGVLREGEPVQVKQEEQGEEDDREGGSQALVLRIAWPMARFGQIVSISTRSCSACRRLYVEKKLL